MSLPDVTIIVLNWNARDFLPACLTALFALDYPDFSVCLVDNGSDDGSVELVQSQFPQAAIICNHANVGFAAGNNAALRYLTTEFTVLLNPDVVVDPDWLRQLILPIAADAQIGVAGSKLYYPGGRLLQHAGGFIDGEQGFPGHFGWHETDTGQYDSLRDVDYVIGAAMAIRRQTLEQIGLLDEGFFLFYEDTDFCFRARRVGYRVVYVPQATAVHVESVKTQKESDSYLRHMYTSRWRFLLKHYPLTHLTEKTVPAERAWLAALPVRHCLAAAHAYRLTVKQLPDIAAARTREGIGPFSAAEPEQVTTILQGLHRLAWQPQQTILSNVENNKVVRERPFISTIPLFGKLIARLRRAWNNVATTSYVRPLLAQQNAFSQDIAAQFQNHASRLETLTQKHVDHLEEMVALTTQIRQMEQHLQVTQERLARLEKEKDL